MISMKKSSLYVFVICLIISLFIPKLFSSEFTVFKNDYIRDNGKPELVVNSFSVFNSNTTWTLKVTNGSRDNNFADKISSAIITLNSVEIISQNQFNQNTNIIQLPVTMENENHLEVQLNGKPGAALSIEIIGIDDNSPTISNITPSNNDIIANNKPLISANFNDDISGINTNSFTLLLDNINITEQSNVSENTFVFNPTSPLNDGLHTLLITIEDNAGNQTQETADFTIDTTPPTIANITPEDGTTTENAKPIISFAYSDSLSGIDLNSVKIILDGDDVSHLSAVTNGITTFLTENDLAEGLHLAMFEVKDNAGNLSLAQTSFTVASANQPPNLVSIGDKNIDVGNTLSFNVTVSNHNSDNISFMVTPIPLLENARFSCKTGLFTFTPDKKQEGLSYTITFIASNGLLTDSETITITVNEIPEVGQTVLKGRILDANDAERGIITPIVGAIVENVEHGISTITDSEGNFILNNLSSGANHFFYDGSSIIAPDGSPYGSYIGKKNLTPNITNIISRPVYLMRLDRDGMVEVDPTKTTILNNPNLNITLTIPSNTVKNKDGSNYSGILSISEVPAAFTPSSLPENIETGLVISIQPMGLIFVRPAPITFPNFDNLSPGSQVNLWSMDHAKGGFFIAGKGQVSADGTVINTIAGGIRETSWHCPLPPDVAPLDNNEDDADRNETGENCNDPCKQKTKSGFVIQSGNFYEDYSIPPYRSLGRQRGLKFLYNSVNAYPCPIITTQTSIRPNISVPNVVSSSLRIGGISFDNDTFKIGELETVRQASMFNASNFKTNAYPYFFVAKSLYSVSTLSGGISGNVIISNQINSPFGSGWEISGLHKLYGLDREDGRVLLTDGEGSAELYTTKTVGTGEFATPIPSSTDFIEGYATGDFNGDNNIDMATIGGGDFVNIMLGDGAGNFSLATILPTEYPCSISTGDFNGDNILDLATINHTNSYSATVFLGNGIGGFAFTHSVTVGDYPVAMTTADFNGDQLLDIAISNEGSGDVSILLGDGTGKFLSQTRIEVYIPGDITSGDFNSDNIVDLAVLGFDNIYGNVILLFQGNGDGTFVKNARCGISSFAMSITTGDFNGDGAIDVAAPIYRNSMVAVSFGDGAGSLSPVVEFPTTGGPGLIVAADFNGDSMTDIATVNFNRRPRVSSISLLFSDGSGNFSPAKTVYNGSNVWSIAQGDFNGDNIIDIATYDNDALLILLGEFTRAGTTPGDFSRLTKNSEGTFTRIMPDGTQVNFDLNGLHTSTIDTNGNTTTFIYDQDGLLTSIIDPVGLITNLDYQERLLSSVTDPVGRLTSFEHDENGNLVKIIAPNGQESSYSYDSRHLMTSETEPNGNTHNIEYSFAGRFKSMHFADGSTQELTPSIQKGLIDLSLGLGDSKENPAPNTFAEEINSTIVDGNGNVTTIKTDNFGKITESTDNCCFGRITKIERNKDGIPTSITKANGAVTTMTYDENGNLLTSTDQSINATTTFTYDPNFNKVTSITDPNGNTTTINYDTQGNPIEIVDALGNITTRTYNTQGQLTTVIDALDNITTFAYDINGNIFTATDPLGNITNLTTDAAGNITMTTDANGNTTQFLYDMLNRLKSVTDANNNTTNYNYDAIGNLTQVIDANSNLTEFEYDSMDRVVVNTDPLGNSDTFTYDGNENLISTTNRNNQIIEFEYDTLNQLIKKSLSNNLNTIYNYDSVGKLTSISDPDSNLTFTYDNADRLTAVSTAGSPNQPDVTINYTYDANGNRISMTDSLTGTTNYDYDTLNRILSITNPSNQKIDFSYDALNRRINTTLPNGVTTNYTYDPNSRLTELQHNLALTTLSKFAYTYDNVGNRTAMNTIRTNLTVNNTLDYSYDNIYQLTQATNPLPSMPDEAFNYDPLGNRLNQTGQTIDSIIGTGNQLLEDDKFTYTYDNNGNLVQKIDKLNNEITSYMYSVENRLVQIDLPSGSVLKYRYDELGRRIEKNIDSTIIKYVYDDEDILLEFDVSDSQIARYTHGLRFDEPLIMERDNQKSFYHVDGLGSIIDITDADGDIVQSYVYDSFGHIEPQISYVSNPYTYTGREYDIETGLYYYRARYYDSGIGRFLSEDPIGLNGGINSYGYVNNNPIYWTDAWGLAPGDSYTTIDGAGKDAIQDINPTSIKEGAEYGGYLKNNSDGTYTYEIPKKGTKDGLTMPSKPDGVCGDYHTHGANDPGYYNEDFSPTDKANNNSNKFPGYLGTPSGVIKKYDPNTEKVTIIEP